MTQVVVLFILALLLITLIVVVAVKATIRSIEGKIPVPRSSERTMEERLQAEIREETETLRAELRRDRERLAEARRHLRRQVVMTTLPTQLRAQQIADAINRSTPFNALNQALSSIGPALNQALGDQGQVRITHTVETIETSPSVQPPPQVDQKPGQKEPDPKPAAPHRKSRYERDPVI